MWSQAQLLRTPGPDSGMPHLTPGGERGRLLPTPSPRPHVGVTVLLPQSRLGQGPTVTSRGPRSTCDSHQDAISPACPARRHCHSTRLGAGEEAAHTCGPGGTRPPRPGRRRHPRIPSGRTPQRPSWSPTVPAVLVQRAGCAEGLDGPGALPGLCLRLPGLLRRRPPQGTTPTPQDEGPCPSGKEGASQQVPSGLPLLTKLPRRTIRVQGLHWRESMVPGVTALCSSEGCRASTSGGALGRGGAWGRPPRAPAPQCGLEPGCAPVRL